MYLLSVLPNDVTIHPLSRSFEEHFVVYISKSPSRNMPIVLGLMKQGVLFAEQEIQGTTYYSCAFSLQPIRLHMLSAIIEMAKKWKGFHLFFNGVLVNNHTGILDTLSCYAEAMKCHDTKAYCNFIQTEPVYKTTLFGGTRVDDKLWLIPCQKLSHARVNNLHPSSSINQLQAYAVKKSCHWCPLLDLTRFKEL